MIAAAGIALPLVGLTEWSWRPPPNLQAAGLFVVSLAAVIVLVSAFRNLVTLTVVVTLTDRGVNASLALVAMDGIDAYLRGDKLDAAEDLRTVAEEILGRMALDEDAPSA